MAAVAERRPAETRQQTTVNGTRKVKRAKPKYRVWNRYRPALILASVVLGLVILLGWMSIYARLAVTGYSRSELVSALKHEQLKNQRLKMKLDSLTRPQSIVVAAEKAGMVYASEYEYVGKPARLADASGTGN